MPRPRKSDTPLSPLALNVQKLRKTKGWSQADLAEQMPANVTYISRIETDAASPSFDFIQKLAAKLGTTADALTRADAPEPTKSELELEDLFWKIRKLRPRLRKDVIGVVTQLMEGFAIETVSYKRVPNLPGIVEGEGIED